MSNRWTTSRGIVLPVKVPVCSDLLAIAISSLAEGISSSYAASALEAWVEAEDR